MGIFDNMRQRQRARQKRRATKQRAKQKRKQTKAAGRFSPEAIAGRQGLIGQLGGQAMGIAGGLLGQDSAMAAYTGEEPQYQETIYVDDGGGFNPMLVWGGIAVAGLIAFMAMKK